MNRGSERFIKKIMTIIITALVTFVITTFWLYGRVTTEKSSSNNNNTTEKTIATALESDTLLTKLKVIKDKINESFIGNVDEQKMKEYAVKGYIAGLEDDYSAYYTKEEMEEYKEETLGNYVGIGVYMQRDDEAGYVKIHEVMEGSPAERAGVKANDLIKKVDDEEVNVDDFERLPSMVKGIEGTTVKITFLRDGKEVTLEIVREQVNVKNVKSQMLNDGIGYIHLLSFDGDVAKQFKDEYNKLQQQGMNKLIIDLRNNGGGIVDEAIKIGDFFTDKGTKLLIQEDKNGKIEETKANNDREITMKTVVLVNEYSASASEILASILKEQVSNATVVGTTTYGKGVIQSLYTLSDGSGLKITTNEYFTPNHNTINKKGIEPDQITEEYSFSGELDQDNDIQLKKAIEVLNN